MTFIHISILLHDQTYLKDIFIHQEFFFYALDKSSTLVCHLKFLVITTHTQELYFYSFMHT